MRIDRLEAIDKWCRKMEANQKSILDDLECLRYQTADSKAWGLMDKFINCSVVRNDQKDDETSDAQSLP